MLTAYNVSSTSLVVKWSHLRKKYFCGKPIGYKIVYHPVDLESDFNFVSVNYTTNKTTLTGLSVYTMYAINVSAVSSGGVGPAKTTFATTGRNTVIFLSLTGGAYNLSKGTGWEEL